MKFSWHRVLNIIFTIILIAGIGTGIYFFTTSLPVKRAWTDWVLDKHEHYLSCYDLPFYPQVQKAFDDHAYAVKQLGSLGAVNVRPVVLKCMGWTGGMQFIKGDVLINFHTRAQKNQIEKFLGKTFFGIPYRAEPVNN